MNKRNKVKSVPQRNLMGYAYACASGKLDNCPSRIQKVADSFLKKGKKKGLASLRKMAKTKHKKLSSVRITENHIIKFSLFEMESYFEPDESSEVVQFLYTLNDQDIFDYLHDYLTVRDKEEKKEYIELINLRLKSPKFNNISSETKSWIAHHLKKRTE